MKIGIDARLIDETGVGRYIRNLTDQLGKIDSSNEYVIFLRAGAFADFKLPNSRWQKRLADVPWHSLKEQIVMPFIFKAEKLDLLHIPYFNVPIFYPGKFIITIHDVTIFHFNTGKATTLPWVLYKIKRFGYYLSLYTGLLRSDKIIVVSESTKSELLDHFRVNADKIAVTYEAVNRLITQDNLKSGKDKIIRDPYILYVGNAYPHKNLEILISAVKTLQTPLKLILVGKRDFFYGKLADFVKKIGLKERIIFFGQADDSQLKMLYRNARALVFPSLMEGFGLPGLEAMAAGTPVVCSDIPVFKEIYDDACLRFDPRNKIDIANKLNQVISDAKLRANLISLGRQRVAKFSWQFMAEKTINLYTSK